MTWNVSGQSLELCNCKMLCPCWLGPEGEVDQGWCGGAFAFDIREGNSDGVDLRGTQVVIAGEWPGKRRSEASRVPKLRVVVPLQYKLLPAGSR